MPTSSVWRSGGFAEWLNDQDSVEEVRKLQEVQPAHGQGRWWQPERGLC